MESKIHGPKLHLAHMKFFLPKTKFILCHSNFYVAALCLQKGIMPTWGPWQIWVLRWVSSFFLSSGNDRSGWVLTASRALQVVVTWAAVWTARWPHTCWPEAVLAMHWHKILDCGVGWMFHSAVTCPAQVPTSPPSTSSMTGGYRRSCWGSSHVCG